LRRDRPEFTEVHMILANLLSPTQLIILLIIVLVLFGSRLPDAMKNLGSSFKSFKKGMAEGEDEDADSKKLDK
jgi:sec-independent protein translocase protein TatA